MHDLLELQLPTHHPPRCPTCPEVHEKHALILESLDNFPSKFAVYLVCKRKNFAFITDQDPMVSLPWKHGQKRCTEASGHKTIS